MLRTFRHKGLRELFETGRSGRIRQDLQQRCRRRLDQLNRAAKPGDMSVPGFDFHPLHGMPKRFSVHVNGPWCITFAFHDGDAFDVDLEQYY